MLKLLGLLVFTGISHGFNWKKSITMYDRVCPAIYAPVCASDGNTYGSMCELGIAACRDASIEYNYRGECVPDRYSCNTPFSCSFLQEPVCGTDGKTYNNYCYFRKAVCRNSDLKKAHNGKCFKNAAKSSVAGDYEILAVQPIHKATGPSKSVVFEHSSAAGQKRKLVRSVTPRPVETKLDEQASNVESTLIKSGNGITPLCAIPGEPGCK